MQRKNQFIQLILVMFFMAIPSASFAQELDKPDPYLWLEEVSSEPVKSWVEEQNKKTTDRLSSDKRFSSIKKQFKSILDSDSRLPNTFQYRGVLYEVKMTPEHPRGIFRRLPLKGYIENAPNWEDLVDVDALSLQDGKAWFLSVNGGLKFSPAGDRVLLPLSDAGADESILREFDLVNKAFVDDGFNTPAGKIRASWLDDNTVAISLALEADEKTRAGSSRIVRKWTRGTDLASAPVLLEVDTEHLLAVATIVESATERHLLLADIASRTEGALYALKADGGLMRLDVPGGFPFFGMINYVGYRDRWIMTLETDWAVDGEILPAGSLVSIKLDKMIEQNGAPAGAVSLVYKPPEDAALNVGLGAISTADALYINIMEHVTSRVIRAALDKDDMWEFSDVSLPSDFGTVSLSFPDPYAHEFLLNFQSHTIAPAQYLVTKQGILELARRVEEQIDPLKFTSERYFAVAKDGTKVPYFVVHLKELKRGNAPTLLTGYGAFGVTFQPTYEVPYIGSAHKIWLEQGGVFVSTHGRGGGEYGPKWHQAAQGINRQISFDDIHAISEDLIKRGITSPGKIGFIGGSNGGLTSAILATQRPDLYGAAIALVPIIDMLRYHKLFAGRNWVNEYGDPGIPEERAALLAYSPYHNIFKGKNYPEILLMTSTSDDRVHPAHARKMAAKMIEQDHPVLFYEAPEGGHRMAINNEGRALNAALIMVYLRQKLMDDRQE